MTTPTDAAPLPHFHLNGTGRQALLDQYEAVYRALHEAYLTLCEAGPHERDYYPLGVQAHRRARLEHERRLAALEALRDAYLRDWHALAERA